MTEKVLIVRKRRKNISNALEPNLDEMTKKNCSENVQQYLLNSTLHGLRYVGDSTISVFERYYQLVLLIDWNILYYHLI